MLERVTCDNTSRLMRLPPESNSSNEGKRSAIVSCAIMSDYAKLCENIGWIVVFKFLVMASLDVTVVPVGRCEASSLFPRWSGEVESAGR